MKHSDGPNRLHVPNISITDPAADYVMNLTRLVALDRFMKLDLSESYIQSTSLKNKMTRENGNVFGR